MKSSACEICGDTVKGETTAKCGHAVKLCKDCQESCPQALVKCIECDAMSTPSQKSKRGFPWV